MRLSLLNYESRTSTRGSDEKLNTEIKTVHVVDRSQVYLWVLGLDCRPKVCVISPRNSARPTKTQANEALTKIPAMPDEGQGIQGDDWHGPVKVAINLEGTVTFRLRERPTRR